jgi:hypothetical protein
MSFLSTIVKVVGLPITAAVAVTNPITGVIGKGISKIPVLGKPLNAVFDIGNSPTRLAGNIAAGKNVVQSVKDEIKANGRDIKTAGPYAQMVLSFVPGVGTVASAAIGAGLALANGQPISQVFIAGVKGAIPGGPLATATFDVVVAGVQGHNVAKAAVAELPTLIANAPTDKDTKAKMAMLLDVAKEISKGKQPDQKKYETALAGLPPEARNAAVAAVIVGQAAATQEHALKVVRPSILVQLRNKGSDIIAKSPIMTAGLTSLPNLDLADGFTIGTGFASHRATTFEVVAIRAQLQGDRKVGFDLAMAYHIGSTSFAIPGGLAPKLAFGLICTHGLTAVKDPRERARLAAILAVHPVVKAGLQQGVEIHKSITGWRYWWHRFLVWLGVSK